MIFVDRNKVQVPFIFSSVEIKLAMRNLEDFYKTDKEIRSQSRHPGGFLPGLDIGILSALRGLFYGKCAYCESAIEENEMAAIDRFRPKFGARGLEKEFAEDHYWWLAYEWRNLYYCCSNCSMYKSTWFPVDGARAISKMDYDSIIKSEQPFLLDPCQNNPEEHLVYRENGVVEFSTPAGKITIELLKLNRSDLVLSRGRVFMELKRQTNYFRSALSIPKQDIAEVDKIVKEWRSIIDGSSLKPYLGIQRQLLREYLIDSEINSYLIETNYKALVPGKTTEKLELSSFERENIERRWQLSGIRHIYVEKIEVKNFKCFSYMAIDFPNNKSIAEKRELNGGASVEPWVLFLGENGVGKSSLLKALVIGLSGQAYLNELAISGSGILKHGEDKGFIKICLVAALDPIVVEFDEKTIHTNLNDSIINFVAYNSIRLPFRAGKLLPEQMQHDGVKAKNLFDYTYSLIDANSWLTTASKELFDRAAKTLKDLMLLDQDAKFLVVEGQVLVNRDGEDFRISELSEGYQSMYALATDIMATLAGENVAYDLVEGMVIIDEIGTHLHPRWRMEVVKRFRTAFPKIRFVVTTHEPLCLRGLTAGETVVLARTSDKEIVALTDLPDPNELRVDQILTSEFFGLKSAIDPETEKLFDEYYYLLAIDEADRTEGQKNRLLELNERVPKMKHLGDNFREELVYYVIDELLARKTRNDGLKIRQNLKEEAIRRVESLWKTIPIDTL